MAKMVHTMLRVLDAEKSLSFYTSLFKLNEKRQIKFDDFTLYYLGNHDSDFELELTHNHDQAKPYQHGNAYGHLAFVVDNLNDHHQLAIELGYQPKPIKQFYNKSELVAQFYFIEDPDGYSIEVIAKSNNYQ